MRLYLYSSGNVLFHPIPDNKRKLFNGAGGEPVTLKEANLVLDTPIEVATPTDSEVQWILLFKHLLK